MTDNSFLNKILLLLEKTKDALIDDLKKEFVSVRIALDENAYNEEDFSLTDDFKNKVNIIDAVFAKVGYDISHYNQLDELKQLVFSMLKTVEGLTRDAQQLSESYKNDNKLDGEEVSQFLESAMPHIKTLLTLVKTIVNIEWNKVAEELYGAGSNMGENLKDQFLNKEFARKVLDHILITLLKKYPQVNGLSWWYPEANAYGCNGDLKNGWYNASLFDNSTGCALKALYEMQQFK